MASVYELAAAMVADEKWGGVRPYPFADKVLFEAGLSLEVTNPEYSDHVEQVKRAVEDSTPHYLIDLSHHR